MKPRIAWLWIALVLAIGSPWAAAAEEPVADPHADNLRRQLERWERQEAEEKNLRQQWRERERERIKAVDAARAQLAEVQANRVRAKDGAYDGIKRSEWTRRAEEAQKDVDRAKRDLAELHEEARQAEVPAGWFESDD